LKVGVREGERLGFIVGFLDGSLVGFRLGEETTVGARDGDALSWGVNKALQTKQDPLPAELLPTTNTCTISGVV